MDRSVAMEGGRGETEGEWRRVHDMSLSYAGDCDCWEVICDRICGGGGDGECGVHCVVCVVAFVVFNVFEADFDFTLRLMRVSLRRFDGCVLCLLSVLLLRG